MLIKERGSLRNREVPLETSLNPFLESSIDCLSKSQNWTFTHIYTHLTFSIMRTMPIVFYLLCNAMIEENNWDVILQKKIGEFWKFKPLKNYIINLAKLREYQVRGCRGDSRRLIWDLCSLHGNRYLNPAPQGTRRHVWGSEILQSREHWEMIQEGKTRKWWEVMHLNDVKGCAPYWEHQQICA